MVAATGYSENTLEFYKSTSNDFYDPNFEWEHFDTITTEELQALADRGYYDFSPEPQAVNLLIDETDRVYLIGTANVWEGNDWFENSAPIVNGSSRMWLWEVKFPTPGQDQDIWLKPVGNEGKRLDSYGDPIPGVCQFLHDNLYRQEANFNAGSGAYVSPTGELLYYATSYWHLGPGEITRMAELRSK